MYYIQYKLILIFKKMTLYQTLQDVYQKNPKDFFKLYEETRSSLADQITSQDFLTAFEQNSFKDLQEENIAVINEYNKVISSHVQENINQAIDYPVTPKGLLLKIISQFLDDELEVCQDQKKYLILRVLNSQIIVFDVINQDWKKGRFSKGTSIFSLPLWIAQGRDELPTRQRITAIDKDFINTCDDIRKAREAALKKDLRKYDTLNAVISNNDPFFIPFKFTTKEYFNNKGGKQMLISSLLLVLILESLIPLILSPLIFAVFATRNFMKRNDITFKQLCRSWISCHKTEKINLLSDNLNP
jgi:hypothetical protein